MHNLQPQGEVPISKHFSTGNNEIKTDAHIVTCVQSYSASTVSGATNATQITLTNHIAEQKQKFNQTKACPIKRKHGVRFRKPVTAVFTWVRKKHRYRRMASKKLFQPFFSHIHVLSRRIKCGYGPKKFFSLFLVISTFYAKAYNMDMVKKTLFSPLLVISAF